MNNIYIVGGYVRDKLLGIKSNDIDFCFVINQNNENILIEDGFQIMKKWILDEGFTIFLETPSMVTIRAKFPNLRKYNEFIGETADFVLSRKELFYNNDSRKPEVIVGTLEDDLSRRDFTINAMALDINGNLIDFHNGMNDLDNKILRTPNNPLKTMLDDPLRVLRAIRFSITKDFEISNELFDAIINNEVLDKLFNVVSIDRIREELTKMFIFSTPKTIKILMKIDCKSPNFINKLFENKIWLKPTVEKRK